MELEQLTIDPYFHDFLMTAWSDIWSHGGALSGTLLFLIPTHIKFLHTN